MSHDESSAIEALRQTIRWLIGGIASLLVGAATVGGWVATQESRIGSLVEADKLSMSDRSELRGQIKAHSESISVLRQDTALQNRDLQYIRESVTKIERALTTK
jgi:hypothetical protein